MSGTFWVLQLAKLRAIEVSGRAVGAAEKFSECRQEPRCGSCRLRLTRQRR